MTPNLTETQRAQILEALRKGNKIEAIKLYREATSAGLRDSKEYIDQLASDLEKKNPGSIPKASGCGSAAVLFVGTMIGLVASLYYWI